MKCSIDGCEFEASTRSGMWSHAKKHIRQAKEVLGRETEEYAEVRDALAGRVTPDGDLRDTATRGEQATLNAVTGGEPES